MDVRSWKKILLQWVTECAFTERNYFNIEQSDVFGFFKSFHKNHKAVKEEHKSSLIIFLRHNYPDFEPHLDEEEDGLSAADYIYVYSLLLHYSCVKYPEAYFHAICQKLPEHSQQCIATFFRQLLDCNSLSKDDMRQAIAYAITQHSSPASCSSGNESYTSNAGQTPLRTPKQSPSSRVSPSTPKTFLLDERTKELYNLRAQLETERYEKGLLEVQIKQNEDKFLKLNQDHKKLQQQIQDLKNDILAKNTESSLPRTESDDQMKRRLCREISQKEQEISNLSDIFNTLKEEKNLLQEKLVYAEKQIFLCMDRISELDCKVDELLGEVEQKNSTIKYLTDAKSELEQFISETRSSSKNPDFNSSADCLDNSFQRGDSSTSTCAENLGTSVVDMQLREKEHENLQLREELMLIRLHNTSLARQMQKVAVRYLQEFDLKIEIAAIDDEDTVDPTEYFTNLVTCMNLLTKSYKEDKYRLKNLEEETHAKQRRTEELNNRVSDLEKEIFVLKEGIRNVGFMNGELELGKKRLQEKITRYEEEIQRIKDQKFELVGKLESLANECTAHKDKCEAERRESGKRIEKLEKAISMTDAEKTIMSETNAKLKDEVNTLQSKVQALQQSLKTHTDELKTLNETIKNQTAELEASQAAELAVKEKYEKLIIQHEAMKRDKRVVCDHLEAMRNQLAVKEMEMGKLGTEIVDVHMKNAELEGRIDQLVKEYKAEKQNSGIAINKRDERIREMSTELSRVKSMLEHANSKMEVKKAEHDSLQEEGKSIATKIEALGKLLDVKRREADANLCSRLGQLLPKVKELVDSRVDATAKIDLLEFDNTQNMTKLQTLEAHLKTIADERTQIVKKHEEVLMELKQARDKIRKQAQQLEELKAEQKRFAEESHSILKLKDEEFTQLQSKHEQFKRDHADALKTAQELTAIKTCEIFALDGEHNELKKKFIENKEELEQYRRSYDHLQNDYEMKYQDFEEKVNDLTIENARLKDDILQFKEEHGRTVKRLRDADDALSELSCELNKENETRSDLNLKLKASEVRLMETEMQLESILKEKSHTITSLQSTYEIQAEQLASVQASMVSLQTQKSELLETIDDLKQCLQESISQKDRMASAQSQEQLQQMRQLEKSIEMLTASAEAKDQLAAELEQRCSDLKAEIEECTHKNIQLQSLLGDKENQWREVFEAKEQEHDALLSKHTSLIQQLELHDSALAEIMTVMENNSNISLVSSESSDVKNLFNIEGQEYDTNFGKLKTALNQLMSNVSQLRTQIDNLEQKRLGAIEVLTKANEKLNTQLMRNKSEIDELQKLLASEAQSIESKLSLEVKRLNEDIQNLEMVNEKLTDDNTTLQFQINVFEEETAQLKQDMEKLTEQKNKLTEELQRNKDSLDRVKREEKRLGESVKIKQGSMEKLQERFSQMERQFREKCTRYATSERELQTAKGRLNESQTQLQLLQQKYSTGQSELREQSELCRSLQTASEAMEAELMEKTGELVCLQAKVAEANNARQQAEQQYLSTSKRLDEVINAKLATENNFEQLTSQHEQLGRDHEFAKAQHLLTLTEVERLNCDLNGLKNEKKILSEELKDIKRDLQRANDNVSQLIQEIGSIRLEKEAMLEENQLLRKQLAENGKNQSSSESKLKAIVERSQTLERNLLAADNELKMLRSQLEKTEANIEKLETENKKLRDSQEAGTKRIEKLALKLGDSQARCAKLERDNEKFAKTLEANNATLEALQKEKDALQNDGKSLKERLTKAERTQEQCHAKLMLLEQANIALEAAKVKLEASESDAKLKLSKLEKLRETNEEKIRKLNHALDCSENANVRLNLEVGALNSQFVEVKNAASAGRSERIEVITKDLIDAKEQAHKYEELNEQLEAEAAHLREENSNISDQLSKLSLSLKITKDNCTSLSSEMEQLRSSMTAIKEQKAQVEREHAATCAKLKEFELLNEKVLANKREDVATLEARVAKLEGDLEAKSAEVLALQQEIHVLRQCHPTDSSDDKSAAATEEASAKESLDTRLAVAEAVLAAEREANAKLRQDNQILQAKYRESKQRLLNECKISEERIKENRLELEGKLEKMKNKMKTLYTEEVTKMKAKQEREVANFKSEMDVLRAQNNKYEEHTRKLSTQIARLNEKILELQKENAFLSTKLKHLEEREKEAQFKRPSSIHISTISSTTSAPTSLGTNLAMEDEEGEVFNNTYLADLKSGRMSMCRDICPEELQYRNSLVPPHLKSTYAAQYDHGLPEDELKDGGPHSLDDSMSALLSTTLGGTRKKLTGFTNYKRPGPPTPSKNGGRLSLGGTSEPAREILKEAHDNSVSSTKTPARFAFFSSRFSMGNGNTNPTKDEFDFLPQQFQRVDLRKAVQRKYLDLVNVAETGTVCTSTPRKSKSHFDQRRLLDQILLQSSTTPSPSPLLAIEIPRPSTTASRKLSLPNVSFIETPVTALTSPLVPHMKLLDQQQALRRRRSRLLRRRLSRGKASSQDTTSSANTPSDAPLPSEATSSSKNGAQSGARQRTKRDRKGRPSLCLRGNIFAKYRTPIRTTLRDLNRKKAHKQRVDNFNKARCHKPQWDSDEESKCRSNRRRLSETVILAEGADRTQQEESTLDAFDSGTQRILQDEAEDAAEDAGFEVMDVGAGNVAPHEATDDVAHDTNNTKLVTIQDLIEFDRRLAAKAHLGGSQVDCISEEPRHTIPMSSTAADPPSGDTRHFEHLLAETASYAPFEVNSLRFSMIVPPSHSTTTAQTLVSSTTSDGLTNTSSLAQAPCSTAISSHHSPTQSSPNLSHVVYGSIIYNHRLPHINMTYVRKSSIYVKDSGVILVTDQTITAGDLLRMWKQMNIATRLLVVFVLLASVATVLRVLLALF